MKNLLAAHAAHLIEMTQHEGRLPNNYIKSKTNTLCLSKNTIQVYFDGACEPNPSNKIAYGGIIFENGKTLHTISEEMRSEELLTNNVAEYFALISCLNWLLQFGHQEKKIHCLGDSKLVIFQLNGKWQITGNKPYVRFAKHAFILKQKFMDVSFQWIPRSENQIADSLSRQALRSQS